MYSRVCVLIPPVIFTMHSNIEYQLFLDHFDVYYTVAKKPVLGILLQLPA